jgi:hypothetical protein
MFSIVFSYSATLMNLDYSVRAIQLFLRFV